MKLHSICHVSVHGDPLGRLGTPDTGGQCVYIKEICKALGIHQEDLRIDIFTRWYEGKPREELIHAPNVRVIRIPCGPSTFVRKEDIHQFLDEFVKGVESDSKQQGIDYQLIHSHYWDGGVAGLSLSQSFGIPLIHTNHSLGLLKKEVLDRSDLNYTHRIRDEKRILTNSSGVVTLSESQKGALTTLYGVSPLKIFVIPGGVDLSQFYRVPDEETIRHKLGINSDFLLFMLGRCDPRKGFDRLLKVIPGIKKQISTKKKKLSCLIATGRDEKVFNSSEAREFDHLVSIIEQLHLTEDVKIIGYIDQPSLKEYFSAADLLIVPSLYEPFGLVILEAMACGCPVIATDNGGPRDILQSGAGLTIDFTDAEEMTNSILKVLLDTNLWSKMSHAGIKTSQESYSWSIVALRLYQEVYLKILSSIS